MPGTLKWEAPEKSNYFLRAGLELEWTESWSTNVRFGFLQTANIGLYVVFNENREVGGIPLVVRDRSIIVKYGYMFDLLD